MAHLFLATSPPPTFHRQYRGQCPTPVTGSAGLAVIFLLDDAKEKHQQQLGDWSWVSLHTMCISLLQS